MCKSSLESPSWVVERDDNATLWTCNYSRSNSFPAEVRLSNKTDVELEIANNLALLSTIGGIIDTVTGTRPHGVLPKDDIDENAYEDDFCKLDTEVQTLLRNAETDTIS